jgi:cytochrome c biogenesis protein CcdA
VALLFVGKAVPTAWSETLDRVVGVAMILLGIWALRSVRTLHAHEHTHADGTHHTHLHHHDVGGSPDHAHRHAATAFGMLHGLAGTGPAVALVPLITLRSTGQGALYLFLFGLGTALGMGSYALIAGTVANRIGAVSERLGRILATASGLFAMGVGVIWILR